MLSAGFIVAPYLAATSISRRLAAPPNLPSTAKHRVAGVTAGASLTAVVVGAGGGSYTTSAARKPLAALTGTGADGSNVAVNNKRRMLDRIGQSSQTEYITIPSKKGKLDPALMTDRQKEVRSLCCLHGNVTSAGHTQESRELAQYVIKGIERVRIKTYIRFRERAVSYLT
jgi:hypothetical protein